MPWGTRGDVEYDTEAMPVRTTFTESAPTVLCGMSEAKPSNDSTGRTAGTVTAVRRVGEESTRARCLRGLGDIGDVLARQTAAFRSVDSPWCCSKSPDRCKLPEHRTLGACGLWDFWRLIVGGFEVDVLARQAALYDQAWAYIEAVAKTMPCMERLSDGVSLPTREGAPSSPQSCNWNNLDNRLEGAAQDGGNESGMAPNWQRFLDGYPWPADQAYRVMMCESGGNPNAISPDGQNWGLMQLNLVHLWRVDGNAQAFLDPATNIRVAYEIWSEQSWIPWAFKP